MKNIKNLLESCIGQICIFKNDSKNYMDTEKFNSLKKCNDGIIETTQGMIERINDFTILVENHLKPYIEEDANNMLYTLNNMKECAENIQNEAKTMCLNSTKYTCTACRSFHLIELNMKFFHHHLKILGISLYTISSLCGTISEYVDDKNTINILFNKLCNINYFSKIVNRYNSLNNKIIDLLRLLSLKQYCICHTVNIRKARLEELEKDLRRNSNNEY